MIKILIGISIFTAALFYRSYERESNYQQLCEAKGGKTLRARDLMTCVDPKIFIEVN